MNKTPMKKFWLMKSEPDEVSVDDALAAPDATISWFGVRNYQARNFMRDAMQAGDGVLFYHSSCAQPGIAGIAEIVSHAHPDQTQFDLKSPYFEIKTSLENPRWLAIDVKILYNTELIALNELRQHSELEQMTVLKKGNRLSITPVTVDEWNFIVRHLVVHV